MTTSPQRTIGQPIPLQPPEPPEERRPEGSFTSEPHAVHPAQSDQELFRELMNGFTVLAETCDRFSREVYRRSGTPPETDLAGTVERNLKIARTVFEKWCLEILAVTYLNKSSSLPELERALGAIHPTLLRVKLRKLVAMGLVQTNTVSKRNAERRYSLTHKGQMITRLGEPVFLYLRLADGWRNAPSTEASETEPMDHVPESDTA